MTDPDSGPPPDWFPAPGGGMVYLGPNAMKISMALMGRQEKGAMKNGTRVRKINGEPKDRTPDGTLGTVKGSVGDPSGKAIKIKGVWVTYGYVVEWDNCPEQGVFTVDRKVEEAIKS